MKVSKEIQEEFKEENVSIFINANQTFIKFHIESDYIIAPRNYKRTGRSVKTDTKLGFTLIVTAKLNTSTLNDLFLVFAGAKIEDTAR